MTKSTKIFFAVLCLVLMGTTVFGIMFKSSIRGEENPDRLIAQNADIEIALDKEGENPYFCNDVTCSLNELKEQADLIAVVSVTDERTMELYSTKSQVKIEKIIAQRDSDLAAGDEIWVEELATIVSERSFHTEGYTLMEPGQQYLLLLQHLPCIDGYRYSKAEQMTYTPVSTYFGKYCITQQEKIEALDEKEMEQMRYKDILGYALLTTDSDKLAHYEELYQEILKNLE